NPDLRPEETLNFEVSTLYEGEGFTVGATAFHTKFDDKLVQRDLLDENGDSVLWLESPQYWGGDGQLHYRRIIENVNIDKAIISGLELTGDWSIRPTLTARASYTYTKSEQQSGTYAGFPLA